MTTRKIAVFFYGLFMDMSLLHHRGLVPSHPQIACLDGYDIAIGDRATLVAHAEAHVYGVVTSLTYMAIDTLYAEPSVADYRPEAVFVTLGNGCQVPALCYNLPQIVIGTQHNTAYALKLLELAQTLGFPRSYLDRLQGLAQYDGAVHTHRQSTRTASAGATKPCPHAEQTCVAGVALAP